MHLPNTKKHHQAQLSLDRRTLLWYATIIERSWLAAKWWGCWRSAGRPPLHFRPGCSRHIAARLGSVVARRQETLHLQAAHRYNSRTSQQHHEGLDQHTMLHVATSCLESNLSAAARMNCAPGAHHQCAPPLPSKQKLQNQPQARGIATDSKDRKPLSAAFSSPRPSPSPC